MNPVRTNLASILSSTLAVAFLCSPLVASAQDLAAAQTSYTGAIMLSGDIDVTIGEVYTGANAQTAQDDYAFFSGNTLYVGTEDAYGNGLDSIIEFFWFESSIDRESDFYVAVIKARSNPNINEDWYLEVENTPVLGVNATSDISSGSGAFRWDWSLPFENYGMDSYGSATLTNSYGIGASAEGAAMAQESIDEDGNSVSGNIQTKGFVNSQYLVQTQYQVTLYRWELEVDGSPGSMNWDMVLNTSDRDEENAYHEYFLVMQTDFDEPFTIENLTVSAGYDEWDWGFGTESFAEVTLDNITLNPPFWEPPIGDDDDEPVPADDDDASVGDDDDSPPDTGSDDDDEQQPPNNDDQEGANDQVSLVNNSCSSAGSSMASPGLLAFLAIFGVLGLRRRR